MCRRSIRKTPAKINQKKTLTGSKLKIRCYGDGGGDNEDDGFVDALEKAGRDVWSNDGDGDV